jgi:hypothetical protein
LNSTFEILEGVLLSSIVFFLTMFPLWTGLIAFWLGGTKDFAPAFGFAVLSGFFFGYWAICVIALLDWFSRALVRGPLAVPLFILMVAAASFVPYLYLGPTPTGPFLENKGVQMYATATAVVAACYLVRGIILSLLPSRY